MQPETAKQPQAKQRVNMPQNELDQYVQQGRPTGLLFSSVALLKGLNAASIAAAAGVPINLVDAIFRDHNGAYLKRGAIKRVADVLGIDLTTLKLSGDRVHIFHLSRLPEKGSHALSKRVMRGVGLLARDAMVAELKVGRGFQSMRWKGRMHVAQTDGFRVIFVGAARKKFSIDVIPSGVWAIGDRATSIVPVENVELINLLIKHDITAGEFDELFQGAAALTWDDIRASSRANGISKRDLLKFIESRANEADTEEDGKAIRPTSLALVHNESRIAVNG